MIEYSNILILESPLSQLL